MRELSPAGCEASSALLLLLSAPFLAASGGQIQPSPGSGAVSVGLDGLPGALHPLSALSLALPEPRCRAQRGRAAHRFVWKEMQNYHMGGKRESVITQIGARGGVGYPTAAAVSFFPWQEVEGPHHPQPLRVAPSPAAARWSWELLPGRFPATRGVHRGRLNSVNNALLFLPLCSGYASSISPRLPRPPLCLAEPWLRGQRGGGGVQLLPAAPCALWGSSTTITSSLGWALPPARSPAEREPVWFGAGSEAVSCLGAGFRCASRLKGTGRICPRGDFGDVPRDRWA